MVRKSGLTIQKNDRRVGRLFFSKSQSLPILPPILQSVLDSIEARNLVLLCGAGLSIPEASNLISAVAVARRIYDKYAPTQVLPALLREDIDQLAGHFLANHEFAPLFITRLY